MGLAKRPGTLCQDVSHLDRHLCFLHSNHLVFLFPHVVLGRPPLFLMSSRAPPTQTPQSARHPFYQKKPRRQASRPHRSCAGAE